MKLNKKVVGIALSGMITLGSVGTAFAAQASNTPQTTSTTYTTQATQYKHGEHAQFKAKLAAEAKAKGITVDALKAQFKAKHAAEKGESQSQN